MFVSKIAEFKKILENTSTITFNDESFLSILDSYKDKFISFEYTVISDTELSLNIIVNVENENVNGTCEIDGEYKIIDNDIYEIKSSYTVKALKTIHKNTSSDNDPRYDEFNDFEVNGYYESKYDNNYVSDNLQEFASDIIEIAKLSYLDSSEFNNNDLKYLKYKD